MILSSRHLVQDNPQLFHPRGGILTQHEVETGVRHSSRACIADGDLVRHTPGPDRLTRGGGYSEVRVAGVGDGCVRHAGHPDAII